jgi:hypothetical protein
MSGPQITGPLSWAEQLAALLPLAPCPHCGGEASCQPSYAGGRTLYTVYCTASSFCPALVRTTVADAVAGWNKRAPRPASWPQLWRDLRALLRRRPRSRVYTTRDATPYHYQPQ